MHTLKLRPVQTNFAIQHNKISEIQRMGRLCLVAPLIYQVSLLMNDIITTDPHVGFQKSKNMKFSQPEQTHATHPRGYITYE